ncbi:unnamed protein product [Orchesella dallaii]|uniref:Uncharacterized protein n=1 Tax=Orchesella dallaii TaxID=48710 RepID=A0ABP1Q5M1_9HEXA
MGQYTRTRRRISNSSINGSGGGRTELDSGGSGGHNFSCLNKGISRRSKDCDKIVCCSSSASTTTTTTSATSTSAGNRSTISSCDSADEALWTRSKKTTIIPQRKGQRPLQLCVGNCPNGPTPPLSPSSSSSTLLTMTAGRRGGGSGDDDDDGGSTTDLSSSCARSSPQSHSSSRWKHYRRLLAFRNFYHHRHSLRWDFFGHASVSFTLLCGSILILLGSRNDLLGQCVRGDEISEADKPNVKAASEPPKKQFENNVKWFS